MFLSLLFTIIYFKGNPPHYAMYLLLTNHTVCLLYITIQAPA